MHISDMVRAFSSNQTVDNKVPKGTRGTNGSSNAERAQASSSSQGLSSLTKGETFEGNVSKVDGDKVTLSLSNGETVTAKLADKVPIKEGESVFFQVKSNDGNVVNIRPVSIGAMQNPILLSALSAAGLSASERNVSMVHNMMQEQMPVNTASLSDMARTVAMHPGTDVSTLVTMQKVGLPITDEMIQQFENYKESEGAILDTVNELVDGMQAIFENPEATDADTGAFANNLLSIIGTEEGVVPHLFTGEGEQIQVASTGEPVILETQEEAALNEGEDKVIDDTAGTSEEIPVPAAEGEAAPVRVLSEEGTGKSEEKGSKAADEAALAKEPQVLEEAAVEDEISDPIEKLKSRFEEALKSFESGNGEKRGTEIPSQPAAQQGIAEDDARDPVKQQNTSKVLEEESVRESAVIESADDDSQLLEVLKNTPGEERTEYPRNSVGSTLDAQQQKELVALLKELSVDTSEITDKDGNLKKDLNTTELVSRIIEQITKDPEGSKEQLGRLFKNDAFGSVIKDAMAQRWTLPPEKVADKQAVKALYAKLSVDMERLGNVAFEASKGANPVSNAAESIRSNVDFINQVNQIYNYIQLPLKLAGQQATGDLYVYSNKKKHYDENDEISAFLHFDLKHLGSTDISVKLKNKKVSTDFYMADDSSFDLIEKNLPILQEKLEKLGYTVSLNVSHDEETVDFVEDFLKQGTSAGADIRRYTFDMMA